MLINNKLEVFENFWIDSKLKPKKNDKIKTTPDVSIDEYDSSSFNFQEDADSTRIIVPTNDISTIERINFSDNVYLYDKIKFNYMNKPTLFNFIKFKTFSFLFNKGILKNKKLKNKIKYENIESFFKNIKNSLIELDINPDEIDFFINAINEAKQNGQIAFSEILSKRKNILIKELNLLKYNVVKYVTEEDVLKFLNITKNNNNKVLKLTWLKNYIRIIPQEILDIKKTCDTNYLFDNYVILHFDKNDSSTSLTEKEKEKAKDPILFGVLQDSRKLYFIGDWVDEYCDLTLDEFLTQVNQKNVKKLTRKSIEKSILKNDKKS
jgi:hypothetical protein